MSNWQTFDAPNLGLLFYKRLYQEDDIKKILKEDEGKLTFKPEKKDEKKLEFDVFYKAMYAQKIGIYTIQNEIENLVNAKFSLFTTYPGLLIGTGYNHGTKSTGDATIGFYFDHVTGLPTIPGSSVKGLLRSAFPQWTVRKEESEESKKAKTCWIASLLSGKKMEDMTFSEKSKKEIHDLEIAIFGETDEGGKDVFFDAIIDTKETKTDHFLDKDFITPHIQNGMSYEQAMLKNPTPLQLLKVLPNIAFEFRFKLTNEGCKIAEKEKIFKEILLTLGIGAKTNVGYGQFSLTKSGQATQQTPTKPDDGKGKKPETPTIVKNVPPPQGDSILDRLKEASDTAKKIMIKDFSIDGEIVFVKKENCLIEISINGERILLKKKIPNEKVGTKVRVTFLQNYAFPVTAIHVTIQS